MFRHCFPCADWPVDDRAWFRGAGANEEALRLSALAIDGALGVLHSQVDVDVQSMQLHFVERDVGASIAGIGLGDDGMGAKPFDANGSSKGIGGSCINSDANGIGKVGGWGNGGTGGRGRGEGRGARGRRRPFQASGAASATLLAGGSGAQRWGLPLACVHVRGQVVTDKHLSLPVRGSFALARGWWGLVRSRRRRAWPLLLEVFA